MQTPVAVDKSIASVILRWGNRIGENPRYRRGLKSARRVRLTWFLCFSRVRHTKLPTSSWNRRASEMRTPPEWEKFYAGAMLELNSEARAKLEIAIAAVEHRLMELPETQRLRLSASG
jgi:hypothetical protein